MGDQSEMEMLLTALHHPVRRTILGVVPGAEGRPLSPRKISTVIGTPLSDVCYHTRVLVACGTLCLVDQRPVRGTVEHFYEATALGRHPLARTTIELERHGGRLTDGTPGGTTPTPSMEGD